MKKTKQAKRQNKTLSRIEPQSTTYNLVQTLIYAIIHMNAARYKGRPIWFVPTTKYLILAQASKIGCLRVAMRSKPNMPLHFLIPCTTIFTQVYMIHEKESMVYCLFMKILTSTSSTQCTGKDVSYMKILIKLI
jgi:hypothetical protein